MTHGARSPRRVLPLRDEIKRRLLADPGTPGYVAEPKFAHALDAWATAEAVLQLVVAELSEVGIEVGSAEVTETAEETTDKGGRGSKRSRSARSSSALDNYHRAASRAANARKELGLSPASYASIARDVGLEFQRQQDAVTRLAADGREIMRRRSPALAARLDAQDAAALPPAGPADC